MKLYFDLDTKRLINPPGTGGTVREFSFVRGDYQPLEAHFLKGGVEVTDVSGIVFVIKANPGPEVPSLAAAQAWELEGTAFVGEINLNGSALNTLVANKKQVSLLCELTCFHGGVGPITSQLVTCKVGGDLWRGNETSPDMDPTPDDNWVAHGHAQELTAEQRERAMGNMGIPGWLEGQLAEKVRDRTGRGYALTGPYRGGSNSADRLLCGIVVWFSHSSAPTVNAEVSTGYGRTHLWDGNFGSTSGSGSSVGEFNITTGTLSSPYNSTLPKAFTILPTTVGGSTSKDGRFTRLSLSGSGIDGVSFGNSAETLVSLVLTGNTSGEVEVSDLPVLTAFRLGGPARRLVFRGCPALESLEVSSGGESLRVVEGYDPANIRILEFLGSATPPPDLTLFPLLEEISFPSNGVDLGNVDLSACPGIRKLTFLSHGSFNSITWPEEHSLEMLSASSGLIPVNLINGALLSKSLVAVSVSQYATLVGTSINGLDFSGNAGLLSIEMPLPTHLGGRVNLAGCVLLSFFSFNNSGITGIDGGEDLVSLADASMSTYAVNLHSCALSAAEIDAFFTSLPATSASAGIVVTGNPGAGSCTPSIATAKGYVVYT